MEQVVNLIIRLALIEIMIDYSFFDRQLSLAIDRLALALEGGGG